MCILDFVLHATLEYISHFYMDQRVRCTMYSTNDVTTVQYVLDHSIVRVLFVNVLFDFEKGTILYTIRILNPTIPGTSCTSTSSALISLDMIYSTMSTSYR
jgi:hypothetical protein